MNMQNGQHKDDELEAPPKLLAALSQLPQELIFVPRAVDEALVKAARRHLSPAQKKNSRWFRLVPWTVATAGFAAAVILAYPYAKQFLSFETSAKSARRGWENKGQSGVQPQTHGLVFLREDVNQDGKVDILDAFILARELKSGPATDPNLDVNGDGVINHRDIEVIAARAVSLEKRGRS